MVKIILILVLYMAVFGMTWCWYLSPDVKKVNKENKAYILVIMALAFIARAIFAISYKGHETDMNCFSAWSDMAFNDGLRNFYSSDSFTDYPPGYMYVLYVVGALKQLFNASDGILWLIVKSPAIICDIITGCIIYKAANKKLGDIISTVIAGLYVFNPAVIMNSAVWGQVDSVYTLFVILMICLLTDRKTIQAYFVFAICIFIKPQAFMFMPLIIYAIIENVFMPKFDSKKFTKNLLGGICAILMILILSLPFGLNNVISQYKSTLASYPYMTVNAFNIWGALGKNWEGLTPATTIFGYVVLVAVVAYSAYVFFKTNREDKYFFVGVILSFATYMLSTKMHDRYAFPTMALLMFVYLYNCDAKSYFLYSLAALTQFFNVAWVLFIYEQDINMYFKSPAIVVGSIINILLFAWFIYVSQTDVVGNKKTEKKVVIVKDEAEQKDFTIKRSVTFEKLKKADYIFIVGLMIVYGAIAFYNLGDTKAPQTFVDLGNNPIEIDLGEEIDVQQMKFYLGSYNLDTNRTLDIACYDSDKNEVIASSLTSGSVFYWSETEINQKVQYISLSTQGTELSLMEVGLYDSDNQLIKPANISDNNVALLFDEQDLIPERTSFKNSTYFDEIYHARTAYEFVNSLNVYEWTHPPLGKDIIAIGVKLFGMTPFGWRCMGTLFGILMIPVLYIFARRLLKYRWLAMLAAVIFTFDFMHFTQTRISTIDVYVTFFIMLMYYYMYKYYCMSFYDTKLKNTLVPLALSGVFMGFGIASKWTGIYAGVGLAIIFFISLYKRYSEYLYAKKSPNGETNGISHKHITDTFVKNLTITIIWCCIFFVIVPAVIYCLSYIPYLKAPSSNGFKTIIDNQNAIFTYHSKTVVESTHPFSSKWFEWIIMKRPIWYYSGTISDNVKEGISAFGNPLVWWLAIPAFILMIYKLVTDKDKNALFLIIAYIIQILFWVPVSRTTFIYHYFPCVPFIALMIGYSIQDIYLNAKNKKAVVIGCGVYAALTVLLFIMFYPVLSGAPCNVNYAENWLKWFESWVLL